MEAINENQEVVLKVENVNKTFNMANKTTQTVKSRLFNWLHKGRNENQYLKALVDINLEIRKGECFGLIGRNGSGKTTLTKLMSGVYIPDKGGIVERKGTRMLMNLGVGFSHELTARDNIFISSSTLGLSKKYIEGIFDDIIQFAELEDFIDTKIKYFSTGMIQRLSFSIAINAHADIIFLDEVFAVGDARFVEKAQKALEDNWIKGRTVVMVSHSLYNIEQYCQRAAYLEKGKIKFIGDAKEAIKLYNEDNAS